MAVTTHGIDAADVADEAASNMSLLLTAEPQHGVRTAVVITAAVTACKVDAADGADGATSNVVGRTGADRGG